MSSNRKHTTELDDVNSRSEKNDSPPRSPAFSLDFDATVEESIYEEKEQNIISLTEQLVDLKRSIEDAKFKYTIIAKTNAQQRKNVDSFKKQVQEMRTQLQENEKGRQEEIGKKSDLEKQRAQVQVQIDKTKRAMKLLLTRINRHLPEIEASSVDGDEEAEEEIEEDTNESPVEKEAKQVLKKRIRTLRKSIVASRKIIRTAEYQRAMGMIEKTTLIRANSVLEQQLDSFQERYEKADNNFAKSQETLSNTIPPIDLLEDMVNQLETSNDDSDKRLVRSPLEATQREGYIEREKLRILKEANKIRKNEIKQKQKDLKERIQSHRAYMEELNKPQIEEARSETPSSRSRQDRMQRRQDKIEEEQETVANSEREFEQFKEEVLTSFQEKTDKMKSLIEKSTELDEFLTKLHNAKTKLDELTVQSQEIELKTKVITRTSESDFNTTQSINNDVSNINKGNKLMDRESKIDSKERKLLSRQKAIDSLETKINSLENNLEIVKECELKANKEMTRLQKEIASTMEGIESTSNTLNFITSSYK